MAVQWSQSRCRNQAVIEKQLDAGTLTYEEAIKRVYDAIEKLPTKKVVTQQDIQDFLDD